MRIRTILTLRGMSARERAARLADTLAARAAYALPARVRYWAFVQGATAAVAAMPPTTDVPEVGLCDALALVPAGPR